MGKKVPDGYWSKENVAIVAKKYSFRKEFKDNDGSAYNAAQRKKWLDDICSHMQKPINHNKIWFEENIRKEALKYQTKNEFIEKNGSAQRAALNLGKDIYESICSHMKPVFIMWSDEMCKEEALKYKTRNDFKKNNYKAYQAAKRKGDDFFDSICSHMKQQGNTFNKFVYVFLFSDKYVYIGITYNIEQRYHQHTVKDVKSSVYKHLKVCPDFKFKLITKTPIFFEDAQELEHKLKLNYKRAGYKILNVGKTGKGVGSIGTKHIKWSDSTIIEDAKKYNKRSEFKKYSPSAYTNALKKGKDFFEYVCSHMVQPLPLWTEERIKNESMKYNNIAQFKRANKSAYNALRKKDKKFIDEIYSIIRSIKK